MGTVSAKAGQLCRYPFAMPKISGSRPTRCMKEKERGESLSLFDGAGKRTRYQWGSIQFANDKLGIRCAHVGFFKAGFHLLID